MKAGQKQTGKTDTVLWVLVLILVVLGLGALFSASEYNGRVRFHDSAYYFKKQLFATALGLLVKIIGRVVKTHSAIIFACRKKRHQAKHNKDQNQNPENGISLSGLFLFCLHAVASTVVFISAYVCIFRIITVLSHIP